MRFTYCSFLERPLPNIYIFYLCNSFFHAGDLDYWHGKKKQLAFQNVVLLWTPSPFFHGYRGSPAGEPGKRSLSALVLIQVCEFFFSLPIFSYQLFFIVGDLVITFPN